MKLRNIAICFGVASTIVFSNILETNVFAMNKSQKSIDYRSVERDKEWAIKFNDIVDLDTVNNGNIYVLDSNNQRIDGIELELYGGKTILVKNSKDYESGEIYTLVVEDRIVSIKGLPLDEGRELRFKVDVDKSGFSVKGIEAIGAKSLLVEFTEAVDKRAEVPLFYKLKNYKGDIIKGTYENFDISILENDNRFVRIDIKNNNFDESKENLIFLSGELRSLKDEAFNNGEGDWELIDNSNVSKRFEVENVKLLGNRIICMKFSKRISEYDSKKEINFKVYNEYNHNLAVEDSNYYGSHEVRLKLKEPIFQVGDYKVEIKFLRDFTEAAAIKNKKIDLEVKEIGVRKLGYTAKTLNRRTVELKFDEKIDSVSALRPSNYILMANGSKNNGQVPRMIYFDSESKDIVKLFFYTDLKYSGGYTLKVMRFLENSFGDRYDVESIQHINPSNKDYTFEMRSVDRNGKYIVVEFTSEIAESADVMNKEKYELILDEGNGRKVSINCNEVEIVNGTKIKLKFDGMREDEGYILYTPLIQGYFGEILNLESGIDILR